MDYVEELMRKATEPVDENLLLFSRRYLRVWHYIGVFVEHEKMKKFMQKELDGMWEMYRNLKNKEVQKND